MGIPSYFRRILQAYPGCLRRQAPEHIQALCFDFNCLIYRCLRAPTLPAPPLTDPDPYAMDRWEEELLHEVVRTVKEVWTAAGRPRRVFLAVDGVVPMAKLRQQRVRRFKSAWLRKQSSAKSWDSNAITPGTAFMGKLDAKLQNLVETHGSLWQLSGSNQQGEGEHKILQWLRAGACPGTDAVLIYGLDADLILLSMLIGEQCKLPMFLFREAMEFGLKKQEPTSEQTYQCMDLQEFKLRLGVTGYEQVLNYIGLMSLMGNDFLPHSISHKLNEDGHDYVMQELRAGTQLVSKEGLLNCSALREVCARWSADEQDKLQSMIQKKQQQAKRGVLPGMEESEGLPLTWMVETALLQEDNRTLHDQWQKAYWAWILPNQTVCASDKQEICTEYAKGCQWILDYYLGKPVNPLWMFPSWIPPLWSDLALYVKDTVEVISSTEDQPPIQPQEQLAMVLPLDSWGLIRDAALRRVPIALPQYWPTSFGFMSAGRKWLWECEARIPPLTIHTLREAVKRGNTKPQ